MFAAPDKCTEAFNPIEFIVAIGVANAVEAVRVLGGFVHVDIQAVESPKESLSFADVDVDRFNCRRQSLVERRQCEPIQSAMLIADNHSPFCV